LPYPPYRGDKLKIFNLLKGWLSKIDSLVSFVERKSELSTSIFEAILRFRPGCTAPALEILLAMFDRAVLRFALASALFQIRRNAPAD
jgi:hypothetical protein